MTHTAEMMAAALAVTGAHDLRDRDLIGLADLARDEIQQDNADRGRGKGDGAHPRAAVVNDAGISGDAASAAPGGQQTSHQDDEGYPVAACDHVVCSFHFLVRNDQAIDHQQKQVCTDCDNIAHGSLSSLFTHIIENFN